MKQNLQTDWSWPVRPLTLRSVILNSYRKAFIVLWSLGVLGRKQLVMWSVVESTSLLSPSSESQAVQKWKARRSDKSTAGRKGSGKNLLQRNCLTIKPTLKHIFESLGEIKATAGKRTARLKSLQVTATPQTSKDFRTWSGFGRSPSPCRRWTGSSVAAGNKVGHWENEQNVKLPS